VPSRLFVTLALGAAVVATAAVAQPDPQQRLRNLEQAIEENRSRTERIDREADKLERELQQLQRASVDSAARTQMHEDSVTDNEFRLNAFRVEERQKLEALNRRRQSVDTMLAALQRAARVPPEATMVSPGSAVESVRASLLLSAVIPDLVAQSEALKAELAALRQIRSEITARRAGLAGAQQRLEHEQQALERLIERKAKLRDQLVAESTEERRQLAALSASAGDLRNLIDRLEERDRRRNVAALAAPRPGGPAFSRARGTLSLPARGQITQRFGDENPSGLSVRGIVIETRPAAQVIAPFDGRVVFAGDYRRYGQLLIIAHGEGYHSLFAGLGNIDVVVGQWVLAGEPVGRMTQADGRVPELYVEIRRNGEAINPQSWLATPDTKVSG
jgi:septal ring factor EnvC (AmiA/AmiB activator)